MRVTSLAPQASASASSATFARFGGDGVYLSPPRVCKAQKADLATNGSASRPRAEP
jgi:hypothetical protein